MAESAYYCNSHDTESVEEETSPQTLEDVRIHMEKMNEAQEEINMVSNSITELDLQRNKVLDDCRMQLTNLTKKYGTRIEVAKTYYAAKDEISRAIQVLNVKAKHYKDKVLERDAAKETLHLSELRLKELQKEDPESIKQNLVWLEQINIGTQKVQAAHAALDECYQEYLKARRYCQEKEALARVLERKNTRSIRMTKEYYTTRECFQVQITKLVDERRKKMSELNQWREVYQKQLDALDRISREVHADRTARKLLDDSLKHRPLNLRCDVMSIDSSVDLDPHITNSGLNTPTRMSEDEWTDTDSVGCFSLDETNFRRRPGMIVNRTLHVEDHPLASR